jgi:hypothetical protein
MPDSSSTSTARISNIVLYKYGYAEYTDLHKLLTLWTRILLEKLTGL